MASSDEDADDETSASGPAENLTLRTANLIGKAIVAGDYPAGSTLPVESDMGRTFDVSRNILREAIKTLAGKGLLKTARRAGTLVLPTEKWNLLDPSVLAWTASTDALRGDLMRELTQLRVMIEPEVAALAAQNATTAQTLRLVEAYDAMERHQHHAARAIDADILFHRRLFEASHNRLVGSLLPAFTVLLRANFEFAVRAAGGFIRNLGEHRLIAEAVHARDAAAARAAMLQLLSKNETDLAEAFAKTARKPGAAKRRSSAK